MTTLHPALGPCCTVLRVSNVFLKFHLVYGVLGAYFDPLAVFCHSQALKIGPTFHCISNFDIKCETSRCTFGNSPITIPVPHSHVEARHLNWSAKLSISKPISQSLCHFNSVCMKT